MTDFRFDRTAAFAVALEGSRESTGTASGDVDGGRALITVAAIALSGDSLAYELRNTYEGLTVAIEPEHWTVFSEMSLTEFAKTRLQLAKTLDLTRYRKRRRGPKKPGTPRPQYHNGGRASTTKILALRKSK